MTVRPELESRFVVDLTGGTPRTSMVQRPVVRSPTDSSGALPDWVVVEAPLQICLCGEPLATTMRTPGQDHDLALGFLRSEGIIEGADDVGRMYHCGRPSEPGYGDVLDVLPGAGFAFDLERVEAARRGAHSGCGVCGRRSIDDLLPLSVRRAAPQPVPAPLIRAAHQALRRRQKNFELTGGSHAAIAFAGSGQSLAHAEDVGRHNAVDKVAGQLLRTAPAEDPLVLAVSGRASFELVHKAIVGGFTVLSSVSAPSSLAIDLAVAAGLCLVGFVRAGRYNIYSCAERLRGL